ncbi:hypothetical protein CAC42_3759 [Sphaceloma murrayae]|uniref:DUF7605 domain-containing protein n=1 Tax=Sphaceloma murrayae TaxID=2082308 RepID=A0A2K1QHZ0_9PEZI|nr:hypothetical protein CAC42_3759 [Sphaceloma murrayae]
MASNYNTEHPQGQTAGATDTQSDFQKHCTAFTDAMDRLSKLSRSLISSSEFFEDNLKSAQTRLEEHGNTFSAERQKIGLVGASGMGKSSTFNAIIHEKGLSKTSASLEACTSVIWEATGGVPGQTTKYRVKIEYFNDEELVEMLWVYASQYRAYHFEADDDVDPKMEAEYRHGAHSFQEIIRIIFFRVPALQSRDQIHVLLQQDYELGNDENAERLIAEACMSAEDVRISNGPLGIGPTEFDDAEDLRQYVQPMGSSSEENDSRECHWPFVKRIRVYLRDNELLRNIIIGDVAGISDINKFRAESCKRYLREIDYLVIVTNVHIRITSDREIDSLLSDYGDHFEGKTAVIHTRIDDKVNSQEVKRLLAEVAKTDEVRLVHQYQHIQEELRGIGAIKKTAANRRRLASRRLQLVQEKFEVQILLRNAYKRWQFGTKKGFDIPMFFVSNEHYWSHFPSTDPDSGESEDEVDPSNRLSLKSTGIPALRNYLFSIPKDSVYRRLDKRLQHFRGLVEAIKHAVDTQPVRNPEMLAGILADFKQKFSTSGLAASLEADARDAVTSTIRKNALINLAGQFLDEMAAWAAPSIKAGVKKRGVHFISKRGPQNWSMSLTGPARNMITTAFRKMWKLSDQHTCNFVKYLEETCARMQVEIEENSRIGLDANALRGMLDACLHLLRHAMHTFKLESKKQEKLIKLDCDVYHEGKNIFAECMESLFVNLGRYSGRGYRDRVIARLREAVSDDEDDGDLFGKWVRKILERIHDSHETHMKKLTDEIIGEVTRTCDLLTKSNHIDSKWENDRLRGKEFVDAAKTILGIATVILSLIKREVEASSGRGAEPGIALAGDENIAERGSGHEVDEDDEDVENSEDAADDEDDGEELGDEPPRKKLKVSDNGLDGPSTGAQADAEDEKLSAMEDGTVSEGVYEGIEMDAESGT